MPDPGLRQLAHHLADRLARDELIQGTVTRLRQELQCDRVVLYYFYSHWKGQVTFESISSPKYSIFGSTGADDCFNQDYAQLYREGRIRAIPDVRAEPIHPCHKEFLEGLKVRANLAVPILNHDLWGLLIAHDCTSPRSWTTQEIKTMQDAANTIASSPTVVS
ncbi:GAF domain-containing protein [Spirulina sp. CS-785/01]|uniref:GAF domain-containing protein n=1 Tax=Spirulina sp. CS-785/01 TaxID=3021716 RepID=UPI00232E4AD2|nr:GAF domain-containing protein [Spirulina sp. CS-785/01]MDB9314927.1 GAF domain-containing protein [Spirulina sp. CS-785/01]